jgi:hypothetical protein
MQLPIKALGFGLGRICQNKAAIAALSVLALQAASQAQAAAIVYTVDGTYDSTGTLTGTFDVNTATDAVTAVDLTMSAAGGIDAMTFTDPSEFSYYLYANPSFYNLGAEDYDGYQLFLGFQQDGGALASSGFGDSSIDIYFGPGYAISGTITEGPAGVPEPGAWALMLLGVGLAGAKLRRRREQTVRLAA